MELTVENGCFSYIKDQPILYNINFSVKSGELLAILGPNGAGKTTLLRCMMGFLSWNSGKCMLDEEEINLIPMKKLWKKIAYVPQAKGTTSSLLVSDMILLGCTNRLWALSKPGWKEKKQVKEIARQLGISHLLNKKCNEISGGELQMVLIARALAAKPELLILDEPESNLDFKNQLIVLDTMSKLTADGMCCIFNTHYPTHALMRATKALIVQKNGEAFFGETDKIVTEENIEKAFGVKTVIGEVETSGKQYKSIIPLQIAETNSARNDEKNIEIKTCQGLIDQLNENKCLSHNEWLQLLSAYTKEDAAYAAEIARTIAIERFGKQIYFRGIIEFTNHCKCDCYYCGIRCSNKKVDRYRLTKDEILECCQEGYENGFRTFVLQGGEDGFYTDEVLTDIVSTIRTNYKDCAITLSVGERLSESYQKLYEAGADRYLLRHETSVESLFEKIHPARQKMDNRLRCLRELKEIGYQTGCGIMVGVPYQTINDIAVDMEMMGDFKPHMIGIGPFLPHSETPFKDKKAGDVELTLFLLSLCRIMLPDVMLPATTALGTVREDGRQKGVLAGCNVVMPNLSPKSVRDKYLLYNNKAGIHDTAASGIEKLRAQMEEIGYEVVVSRGDYKAK